MVGEFPGLAVLDEDDNLRNTSDFRGVYCALLEQWLGVDAGADHPERLHRSPARRWWRDARAVALALVAVLAVAASAWPPARPAASTAKRAKVHRPAARAARMSGWST